MGREINLLEKFPKIQRNIDSRIEQKTEQDRKIARQFGREFFDGERRCGYGGYHYHPRFWQGVARDLQHSYGLTQESSILDIGCAKGFLLYDLVQLIPGITVKGIDISEYAVSQAPEVIKPFVQVGDARSLPFEDKSFDLVLSLNTIHNFEGDELMQSLQEIERVSRKHAFIFLDAYRSDEEKDLLFKWNLTAKTILHVDKWREIFQKAGYTGDYYWFLP